MWHQVKMIGKEVGVWTWDVIGLIDRKYPWVIGGQVQGLQNRLSQNEEISVETVFAMVSSW